MLAGQSTIHCEKALCDSLGIQLLMRDYSEIQDGKSTCDRISGSGKLRLRAYNHSGNDVTNAFEIKKGMQGINILKLNIVICISRQHLNTPVASGI